MILDRIEIEDAGANPARQAGAIHVQLGLADGPVPVFDIAHALDIEDIRIAPLTGIEAALITTPERNTGAVVLNQASSPQRRNFSLAHELGHFLNPWHKPVGERGFRCSRRDMLSSDERSIQNRHLRQEAEANRFAIELLAPARFMKPSMRGEPDMEQILAAAAALDISKAAAARRYVELHDAMLAIIFSHNGKMTGYARAREFPFLVPRVGAPLPETTMLRPGQISELHALDPQDWIAKHENIELYGQTITQASGYAMMLLSIDIEQDD